jgi:hypothetical protein
MKKKGQVLTLDFRMPHLYRDDLMEIERVLKGDLKAREYKIETSDYEYTAVDQIPQEHEAVTSLRVIAYSPYITLTLDGSSASLYCSDSNDLPAAGAARRIESIVRKRERRWRSLLSGFWFGIVGSIASGIAVWLLLNSISNGQGQSFYIAAFFLVVGLNATWAVTGYRATIRSFSKVEFIERRVRRSFWQRKKDDILADLLKVLTGALAGYLAALAAGKGI